MNELSRPDEEPLRFGTEAFYASLGRAFVVMCAVVPGLFLIHMLNWVTGRTLASAGGVRPRDLSGLDGVLFAPFLHGSFEHLSANSIPLILLGTFVLAAGVRRFLWSTGVIMLVSGVGVWTLGNLFFASEAERALNLPHVGASGVIFGYLGLLLTRGIVEHSWWNAAVAVLIGLLYWWSLAGILPSQGALISWEGHLFGFVGGVVAAIVFRRRRRRAPRVTGPDPTVPLPDFTLPR
jgi:membrane associated rhomboid family serine protease